jgi:hypothetical protein
VAARWKVWVAARWKVWVAARWKAHGQLRLRG